MSFEYKKNDIMSLTCIGKLLTSSGYTQHVDKELNTLCTSLPSSEVESMIKVQRTFIQKSVQDITILSYPYIYYAIYILEYFKAIDESTGANISLLEQWCVENHHVDDFN